LSRSPSEETGTRGHTTGPIRGHSRSGPVVLGPPAWASGPPAASRQLPLDPTDVHVKETVMTTSAPAPASGAAPASGTAPTLTDRLDAGPVIIAEGFLFEL